MLLVEQVSHHPPVTAFHQCLHAARVMLTGAEQPRPRFTGLNVEVRCAQLSTGDCFTHLPFAAGCARWRVDGRL